LFYNVPIGIQYQDLGSGDKEAKKRGSLDEGRNRKVGFPGGLTSSRRGLSNSGGLRIPSFDSSMASEVDAANSGELALMVEVAEEGDFFTKRALMASMSTFSCGGSFLTNPISPTLVKSKLGEGVEGVEVEGVEAEGVEAKGVEAEGIEAEGVEAEVEAEGVAEGVAEVVAERVETEEIEVEVEVTEVDEDETGGMEAMDMQ